MEQPRYWQKSKNKHDLFGRMSRISMEGDVARLWGCGFNLDSISQKASQLEATRLSLTVLAAVGGAAAASLRLRVYLRTLLINPPG